MPLIGKHNIKNIETFSFNSLNYGDIVSIVDTGYEQNYLYIPKIIAYKILDFDSDAKDSDIFINYDFDNEKRPLYKYWRSSQFVNNFPYHVYLEDEVFIHDVVSNINDWKAINDIYDLVALFEKYNIDVSKRKYNKK